MELFLRVGALALLLKAIHFFEDQTKNLSDLDN